MNRHDDMRMHELLYSLLNRQYYIPTYDDIEYAKGLMLEAGRLKPEDVKVQNNASMYGDIVGKAYLFLILYDKMYGEP
jgi:hypothetical protein